MREDDEDPGHEDDGPAPGAGGPVSGSPASHLWERQDGEPHVWFARFQGFLTMGPGRSVRGAYLRERTLHPPPAPKTKGRKGAKRGDASEAPPEPSNAPTAWQKAARAWAWRDRAAAWEAHLADNAREDWQTRAAEQRRASYAAGRSLLLVAGAMAETLANRVALDAVTGRPVFTGPTSATDLDRVVNAATRLHALAFGGGEALAALMRKVDYEKLSDGQIQAIQSAKSSDELILALVYGNAGSGESESERIGDEA